MINRVFLVNVYAGEHADYRLNYKCGENVILDGPLKCETTASQLTIEVVGKLHPNIAYFKFADFRIYQEREISEHVVRMKFKPDSTTLPFADDSL